MLKNGAKEMGVAEACEVEEVPEQDLWVSKNLWSLFFQFRS